VVDGDGAAEVELVILHLDLDSGAVHRLAAGTEDLDLDVRLADLLDPLAGVLAPLGVGRPTLVVVRRQRRQVDVVVAVVDQRHPAELDRLVSVARPELEEGGSVHVPFRAHLDGEEIAQPLVRRVHLRPSLDETVAMGRLSVRVGVLVVERRLRLRVIGSRSGRTRRPGGGHPRSTTGPRPALCTIPRTVDPRILRRPGAPPS